MAVINNQQIQDPSTQGIRGLEGLEGINRLKERGIDIDTSILDLARDYRGTMEAINQSTTPRQSIGFVGVNDSMFDSEITSASQLDNLDNTRGELQPWYAQLGAGIGKGVSLAGTTFLDGTLGLAYGIGSAIANKDVSRLWNNELSNSLKEWNDKMEEWLPNHRT